MKRFWLWLCRFSYARLAQNDMRVPDGIPTIRDADARCEAYDPSKSRFATWGCQGDGHYLCEQCRHYEAREVEL